MKLQSYTITCLPFLLAVAACSPSGYYGSDGQYHAYGQDDTYRSEHAMAATPTNSTMPANSIYIPENNVTYYDRDQMYTGANNGIRIPREDFPPSGMCRIWFADRTPNAEPPAESCQGIQDRAPADAYVIYGK